MQSSLLSKKEAWLSAIRLRTLPLALASILMASFISYYNGLFRWEVFVLAALTTTLLQILSNLSNDYGDSIHGADNKDRQGPVRAVQSGIISPRDMKKGMVLFGILSFISGILLLYVSITSLYVFLSFIGLGLLAILAAITYTSGSNPYGYIGLGDISVFTFFGLVGVLGTYYLHAMEFSPKLIFPAISVGLFSTTVLNINNIRDIDSDTKAGKRSIPVRIGRTAAVKYNWWLVVGGNLSGFLFLFMEKAWGGLLALPIALFMFQVAKNVADATQNSAEIDPFLKKMSISTLVWVFLFGIGIVFIR